MEFGALSMQIGRNGKTLDLKLWKSDEIRVNFIVNMGGLEAGFRKKRNEHNKIKNRVYILNFQ